MSDDKNPKARFREALEKKKSANNPANQTAGGKSKIQGGQSSGGTPKMFRRKSGSS